MKKILFTLISLLLISGSIAYGGTVDRNPYGIATPRIYNISTYGSTSPSNVASYYFTLPTLGSNDEICGIAASQALSNKTLGATSLTGNLTFTVGADEYMKFDATTTANTGTAGVLDINYRTATTTGSAIYLDVESDVAGGASEAVYGLRIQMDDDSNTSTDALSAIYIGTDGNGTGLQHGLNVVGSGIDAAVWAQNGYIRIGTGSSPGVTPGDDDLFVEGTAEIDGALYADGGINLAGTGLTVEGSTADSYETTFSFVDPNNDATVTVFDWSGHVPVVVETDPNTYSGVNETQDCTSISVPDGVMRADTSLRFTLAGTCTGTNAAKQVILYIDDAAISLETASGDQGDWTATFIMTCSAANAQKVMGFMQMGDTVYNEAGVDSDSTDFADGSATTIKTQVVSGNGSDTITQELCIVEFLP